MGVSMAETFKQKLILNGSCTLLCLSEIYLWSCGQRGAQGVLHRLWKDGSALSGHHRHQAAVLGEKHRQVGAAATTAYAVTCKENVRSHVLILTKTRQNPLKI